MLHPRSMSSPRHSSLLCGFSVLCTQCPFHHQGTHRCRVAFGFSAPGVLFIFKTLIAAEETLLLSVRKELTRDQDNNPSYLLYHCMSQVDGGTNWLSMQLIIRKGILHPVSIASPRHSSLRCDFSAMLDSPLISIWAFTR